MKLPTRIVPIALLAAIAHQPSPAARGQAAPPPAGTAPVALQAVRITADLWESPLDRIPASVSVFDESSLRSGTVPHFADLADQIPNLTWSGGTSRPRYFQIRGIGENSQFEGETPDSTVRFLVDHLDFTGLGSLATTFDLRQVEVLRGPQAGAFGANAAGGVVRLVSNAPTPFWSGLLEGTVGGDGLRAGGFALGGPLVPGQPDRLMARLTVHRLQTDGYRDNVTLGRPTNARDELMTRLRVTFNATPQWKWEAAVLYSDLENGYDEWALDNNGRRTYSDQPGRDTQESWAGSLAGTYTGLAGARLTTVTTGTWVDSIYSYDDDWTAASYQGFSDVRRDRDVATQELRLDSAATRGALPWADRWTLGAYFSDLGEDTAYTNEDPDNLRGLRTRYEGRNYALFGQVGRDLDASTRLVVGLRLEQLDLEGRGTRTRFRKTRGTYDPEVSFAPAFDDTLFGGKIALERDLTPRHLAFLSVTRGYKGGGINIDARISPPADPLTYATETLWNYEAGLRGHWLDRRVTGELTAFYLDRRDTQVRDSAGFGGSYRFFTDNAERSHVYGLEASASYSPARPWTLHASGALMDSELESFALGDGTVVPSRRLANTPPYSYTLGARYRAERGWFAQADLVGRGRQYDSNNHNDARRPFQVVNASLGYAWQGWTVTLWGRNLFDKVYDKRVYFFGNEDPDYLPQRYESHADPRQIGVTASYRF